MMDDEILIECTRGYKLSVNFMSGCIKRISPSGITKTVGRKDSDGYLRFQHLGRNVGVHRFIYESVNGKLPFGMVVDHINRNVSDNRICNLRVATISQNAQNAVGKSTRSISGIKGVSYIEKTGNYSARICVDRRVTFLGTFNSLNEASDAYVSAAKKVHTHNLCAA